MSSEIELLRELVRDARRALTTFASVADELEEYSDVISLEDRTDFDLVQPGGCRVTSFEADDFFEARETLGKLEGYRPGVASADTVPKGGDAEEQLHAEQR